MNLARPAGVVPAGPLAADVRFGRPSLFACAGVLAALNAQAGQIIAALQYQPLLLAISTLAGISAVVWFAMYATLKIGFEGDAAAASKRDVLVLAAVVLLSLTPLAYAARAGLLLCGLYLLATSGRLGPDRRVAYVLLALTGPLIWGRILLLALASPLLSLDAHLVGAVIGTHVDGNTVQFAGEGKPFLIAAGCSSVHNMSLAIVLWTTAAALFRVRVDRRYVACGLTMVAWMFALNIARLSSIGLFPDRYHFLHEGAGADLFGWAGLIGAASIAGLGIAGAVRRQR